VKHNIYVPWKVVNDALTTEGNYFSEAMQDLLKAGYHLDVGLDGGRLTFTRAAAFRSWFDDLKAENSDQMPTH
jgi:hypothetical protein